MKTIWMVHAAQAIMPRSEDALLEVVVIHTGRKRTRAALDAAARLARGLNARIRLIVSQPVPFPAQLDEPPVRQAFLEQQFRELVEAMPIETHVEIRLCREWETGALQGIRPGSTVVLGDGARWPFGRERRLARTLRKLGHQVLLVRSSREMRNA